MDRARGTDAAGPDAHQKQPVPAGLGNLLYAPSGRFHRATGNRLLFYSPGGVVYDDDDDDDDIRRIHRD